MGTVNVALLLAHIGQAPLTLQTPFGPVPSSRTHILPDSPRAYRGDQYSEEEWPPVPLHILEEANHGEEAQEERVHALNPIVNGITRSFNRVFRTVSCALADALAPLRRASKSCQIQAPLAPSTRHRQHPFWTSGDSMPETWTQEEHRMREIPQYVFDHAPYVHLYSGEDFWPCDIADHLVHTTPHLNFTPVQAESDHPTLHDLNTLNRWGRNIFLQSDDDVEDRPDWLKGEANKPNPPDGKSEKARFGSWTEWTESRRTGTVHARPHTFEGKRVVGGRSDAPAVLVVINKGDGIVDAFWFFFYSYNQGKKVLSLRFGDHVGDWEHTTVRFEHGKPTEIFFSEHDFGQAWGYEAVEKIGKRPVGYSAEGSHAMYATPGDHKYGIPNLTPLIDATDRGPLWDPAINVHSYTLNLQNWALHASNFTPYAPVEWFYFRGHWGDKEYPLSDPRQYDIGGFRHYVTGPLGPIFKNLGRRQVCQTPGLCRIKHWREDPDNDFRDISGLIDPDELENLKKVLSSEPGDSEPNEYLP